MPTDAALSTLARLGFTQVQAQVWLALTEGFPATGYALAQRLSLPRPNVYAALRELVDKGAAQCIEQSPASYAPLDPQAFLEAQALDLRRQCQALGEQLSRRVQRVGRGLIRTGQGQEACRAHVAEELAQARSTLWLKGTAAQLRPWCEALRAAGLRGVGVKLIVFGAVAALTRELPQAEIHRHEGDGQRLSAATDALLTLARDAQAVTIVSQAQPVQYTYARDHLLVYVIHSYLLHELFLAEMGGVGPLAAEVRAAVQGLRRKHRPAAMERSLGLG